MAQNFPTFKQLKERWLSIFESNLNQTSPLNNKAFLRICATVMAMIAMLLQREVVINTKENLAITASREGLLRLGEEYDLPAKDEESAVFIATLPASTGTVIPALTNFSGDDNGVLYYDSSSVTSVAGVATITLTSRTPGAIGNLLVGQTLTIALQIAGAELVATITAIDTVGANAEDTEVYRQRVLDIIRAPGGGGNSADYRNWSQEHTSVVRAFPYSGLPWDDGGWPGEPPERTVYVEAQESLFTDGIPDASFLSDVKDTIITDPVTLQYRQPLGLTNDTLYVEPIRRTAIYVEITNAVFITGTDAQVKAEIETAVIAYFLGLQPFIQGLDIDADKNNLITKVTISRIVQDVLTANGASVEDINFGTAPSPAFLATYELGQGEKSKLIATGITYA